MLKRLWSPLLLTGLLATACGGNVSEEPETLTSDPIVGGKPATQGKYGLIGALVDVAPDGSTEAFCTGALVYPSVVVTAKHCLMLTAPSANIAFAMGHDASQPDRLIPIVKRIWERTVSEGLLGLGSDTAVVILEKPVWAIGVSVRSLSKKYLRTQFEAVGYGEQTWWFDDPDPPFGTRAAGKMKLAGIGPAPYWQTVYAGDYDAFSADYIAGLSPEGQEDPDLPARIENAWQGLLMTKDYNAVFRANPANTAAGDSGGPILKRRYGRWSSYGVTSGTIYLSGDADRSVPKETTIYATFGPEARHLVRSALYCSGVAEEGECRGKTLARCPALGERRLGTIKKECADTCVEAPAGAQCAPACSADADCDGVATGGVCEDGVCTWSELEKCKAEPGSIYACFYCCLGQEMEGDFSFANQLTCAKACVSAQNAKDATPANRRVMLPGFPQVSLPVLP